MDEITMTPEEIAADRAEILEERAHDTRETLLRTAAALTHAAMQFGGLPHHGAAAHLREMHATLASLGAAVPVKESVTDTHIVSLIDGSKLQTLVRHLTKHGFTPDSYRAAYGLPADYPMVAAAYTRKRAEIAKAQGLGSRKATTATAA